MPVPPPWVPDVDDAFVGPRLDSSVWVDHYLPQWTTPDRSRARTSFLSGGGLSLQIEADQPDWRPEDAPLRVSNLQTAVFSGPIGSTRGTHRHRPDGLVVRTPAAEPGVLWAPSSGYVEVTVSASTTPGTMTAVWLVGVELDSPDDSGEICVAEIDGSAIGAASSGRAGSVRVRAGVKAHHDPRLITDMAEVDVAVRADRPHTWAVRWDADGVLIGCEGRLVRRIPQRLDYPLQLMLDLFEVAPAAPARTVLHHVRAWSL
ncbi:glycoside hydrolase family 16 protein [Herbiconiux sp. P18]|uniref:glycoside hydrolase family 16 protein n=1 Tax=Herbiconiux liangxiaofengii TaxID=3342795 RepID=UPI0035B8B11D